MDASSDVNDAAGEDDQTSSTTPIPPDDDDAATAEVLVESKPADRSRFFLSRATDAELLSYTSQRKREKQNVFNRLLSGEYLTTRWDQIGHSDCWNTFERVTDKSTGGHTQWAKCCECDVFLTKCTNGTKSMLQHQEVHRRHRIARTGEEEQQQPDIKEERHGIETPPPPPSRPEKRSHQRKKRRLAESDRLRLAFSGSGTRGNGLFTDSPTGRGSQPTPYVFLRSFMAPMLTSYRHSIGAERAKQQQQAAASSNKRPCSTSIILPDDVWDSDYPALKNLREILLGECDRDLLDDSAQSFLVELDGATVLTRLNRLGFRPIDSCSIGSGGSEYSWTLGLA